MHLPFFILATLFEHPWLFVQQPGRWRGVYDDQGRLMVAINSNMDT